jgi:hypothetical protein
MNATRRVTANVPIALFTEAQRVTGKGLIETLVRGLELVRRPAAAEKGARLKGELHLNIDLETSRERSRRDTSSRPRFQPLLE